MVLDRLPDRERKIECPRAHPTAPAERPRRFQSDPLPETKTTDHLRASCPTPPTPHHQRHQTLRSRISIHVARILRAHFPPNTVPSHLNCWTAGLHCRAGLLNFQNHSWAARPSRAFAISGFANLRLAVIRRRSSRRAVGNLLQCILLRHDAELRLLAKLPRRGNFLSKQKASVVAPPTHKSRRDWVRRPFDRPDAHLQTVGYLDNSAVQSRSVCSKTCRPPPGGCRSLEQDRLFFKEPRARPRSLKWEPDGFLPARIRPELIPPFAYLIHRNAFRPTED